MFSFVSALIPNVKLIILFTRLLVLPPPPPTLKKRRPKKAKASVGGVGSRVYASVGQPAAGHAAFVLQLIYSIVTFT